jgi:hypothetical protein
VRTEAEVRASLAGLAAQVNAGLPVLHSL